MRVIETKRWRIPLALLTAAFAFYLVVTFDLFLAYQFVAGLLLLVCAGSFFTLLLINLTNNKWPSRFQVAFIVAIFGAATILYMHRNGYFYGKKILDATFLDDMSRMDMYLYEDGHYIITSGWILGSETFTGTYKKSVNTITFNNYPVIDTDFIDKTIIIKGNKIYFNKNTPDTSFYSFKINRL